MTMTARSVSISPARRRYINMPKGDFVLHIIDTPINSFITRKMNFVFSLYYVVYAVEHVDVINTIMLHNSVENNYKTITSI